MLKDDTTTSGDTIMDFGDFYRATAHRTLRYAYGLTGDLPQAQDVTQEAYARAWQRWGQVSGYENVEAWLRLVVTRLVQDWWRHLRVRGRTRLDQPDSVPGPNEDAVLLAAALKRLPRAQSRALALHYLLDLPVSEIAAETGTTENTVRSWLARGRAGLAQQLRDQADTATMPPAEDAVALGRRRRRTRVISTATAAGLAVILVLGIAVALVRARRPEHPVNPAPSGTLHSIGDPVPARGRVQTLIDGGRAYIAANDKGAVQVTALDAATGNRMWTVAVAGTHDGAPILDAAAGELIVSDTAAGAGQVTVLDPSTGRILWNRRQDAGQNAYVTDDVYLMFGPGATQPLTALDWATGTTRWALPGGPTLLTELAARTSGSTEIYTNGQDYLAGTTRLYRAEPTGTIREYALATGRPTGRSWTGAPTAIPDRSFVYRGKLYLVSSSRLDTFDLGGDGPVVAYAMRETSQRPPSVTPCAGNALCVLDGRNLVLLRGGAAPVTRPVTDPDWVMPVGDTIYLERGQIFDHDLKPIRPERVGSTTTLGVDNGKAILVNDLVPGLTTSAHLMGLWLFDPATGETTLLGKLSAKSFSPVVGAGRVIAVGDTTATLYAY